MTTLAATDLDRTLLHSARAAGPPTHHDVICLERHGTEPTASLLRPSAEALTTLARYATWVPATTRSVTEYQRLDITGQLGLAPRYVVCANGGVLLVDGVPDHAWATTVAGMLDVAAPRSEVADLLARHLARLPPGAAGPVRDANRVLLVVRARHTPTWLDELASACIPHGWQTVVHGNKIYLLPMGLTKLAAVEEVQSRAASTRLVAAGDSPLDAELLYAADAAIQPLDGHLYAQGWRAPHVAVTRTTGLRAGHEIAHWLLTQARHYVRPVQGDRPIDGVTGSEAPGVSRAAQ